MLLGQIPGKGPLGEAPFLSTPCPALSVRRQNNFFHKVCPSQKQHTRAPWHGISEGKGLCSELHSEGSWPEIRCLKTWKAARQEYIKDGLYHLVRLENQFSIYGTVAWIKSSSHTTRSFSPGVREKDCIWSCVATLKKQASPSWSQSFKVMEKQGFFKKDMERCHLYAQIKLAKNIGPFKVPAVLLYVSNGKMAPDPGFYYYCYYLKCHLRKKKFPFDTHLTRRGSV